MKNELIKEDETPKNNSKENKFTKSASDELIRIIKGKCKLFSDHEGKAYVTFTKKDHEETYAINSQEFNDYLQLWHYKKTKRAPSKIAIESALASVCAMARFDGEDKNVHLRVAQIDGKIYINPCDPGWRTIQVSHEGFKVLSKSPIVFTRNNKMKSLPIPSQDSNYDESNAKEGIKLLLKHINIEPDQLPLIAGWLLMALQKSKAAYPVILVNGPAGSGKSTACEMLRELVDPNVANLISQPKASELRVVGEENHILGFDNVSSVSPDFSDALCRISTGDNQVVRKLYTTNGSYTLSMHNPILLNGIPELAKRADLVSRSAKILLKKITVRKTSQQAWKDFDNDKPQIFTALLYGLVIALSTYENINIKDMTRMGDFCKFATAAHLAYGWNEGDFMNAYQGNVKSSHVDSLESSTFTSAIMAMFEEEPFSDFNGRPMELLEHLEELKYISENTQRSSKRVSTAKGVVEALDRAEDSLEAIGIVYEKYKDNSNKTFVKLELDQSLIGDGSDNPAYQEPDF